MPHGVLPKDVYGAGDEDMKKQEDTAEELVDGLGGGMDDEPELRF